MTLPNYIDLASNLSPLVPLWVGRKVKGLLWWYAWVCLICDIAGYSENVMGWPRIHANIFLLLEFVLIALYFRGLLLNKQQPRTVAGISIGLIAITFVLYAVFNDPRKANYTAGAFLYSTYILICLAALYRVVQQAEQPGIDSSALFFFSAVFLIYASGSTIMLLFKIFLAHTEPQRMDEIWSVRNILNLVKNLSIAFIFHHKKKHPEFAT
jgi:hypothetical protein